MTTLSSSTEPRPGVSRRAFIAGSGGLTFAFALGIGGAGRGVAAPDGALNAYVHIATDGIVTIRAPAAEMGQGVKTAIPLIVAEELDADWSQVRVEQAPVDEAYNHPIFKSQFTVASLTVKGYWMPCRIAGAQARRVLIDAAAARWNVPAAELSTEPGAVVHAASGRRAAYGEIASFASVPAELPAIAPEDLKPVSAFRLLGRDVTRVDVPEKSTGTARYAMDVDLPGMAYATVARSPVTGSGPESFNGDAVRAMPGILDAVRLEHGVGLIGESVPAVFAARERLEVTWRRGARGETIDSAKDMQDYLAHLREPDRRDVVFSESGDAPAALAGASKTIAREYLSEYYYHAQMEPTCCTASVRSDAVEIWAGTQWQTLPVGVAAKLAGVAPEKVTLHQMQIGGGFGRRAFIENVRDAVLLSKAAGRPVKLIQRREDDVKAARMRPLVAQRVEMGLDGDGRIVALRHRVACQPVTPYLYGDARWQAVKGRDVITMRGSSLPHYDVPDQIAEQIYEMRGARVAAWRGIGCGYTKFALECLVDEVAHGEGRDPLDYRLAMAKDARTKAVLERVGEMSGWTRRRDGTALGVAFAEYGDSLAAAVAEISVNRETGTIRVPALWAVADPGLPLQPDTIKGQMEGGMIFGLSATLREQLTVKDGEIEQSNFHDYPVLRMSEVPEIEVEVIRGSDQPTEVGELGLPLVAPAVANAFFRLTGKRLYHLPFTEERVLAALEA